MNQTGKLEFLRRVIGELMACSNPRLSAECLALVMRLPEYKGCSMAEIGRRHGVTRAAVSKRCAELIKALDLQPPALTGGALS